MTGAVSLRYNDTRPSSAAEARRLSTGSARLVRAMGQRAPITMPVQSHRQK